MYFLPNAKCNFHPNQPVFSNSVTILRRGQRPEYGRDFFKRNFSEYVNGFGIDKEGHGKTNSHLNLYLFLVCDFVIVSEYVNGFGVDKEGHGVSICIYIYLYLCNWLEGFITLLKTKTDRNHIAGLAQCLLH